MYSATASRQLRGVVPVREKNFSVERTEYTGRRAIQFFILASFNGPTVALSEMPDERQQSSANCAYSCQLHSPALAKCRMPHSTSISKNRGSICAISRVYVGVENLSATAATSSPSRARLIRPSMKLGRSGPKTHETRTIRCRRTGPSPAAPSLGDNSVEEGPRSKELGDPAD